MANPFRRQDVSSSTEEASEASVPMPRFGISSPTVARPLSDASVRFPPAEELTRSRQDAQGGNKDDGGEFLGSVEKPDPGRKSFSLPSESLESKQSGTSKPISSSSQSSSKQRMSRVMDVESFKNMLMTGNADSAGSGTTLGSGRGSANLDNESSSSTEPASASRQTTQKLGKGPAATESSSEYSDSDEEMSKLASPKSIKGKPPPPPKSRYGKAIKRGPQTVSFDDFAPSFEPAEAPLRPDHKRTGSGLKPLPPTPQTPEVPRVSVPAEAVESPRNISSENIPTPKKSAPPPPLARRSTVTKRPRGNTASSMQSLTEDQPSRASSITDTSNQSHSYKNAPPPPPSRRMGSSNSILSSNVTPDPPSSRTIPENATSRSRSSSQVSLASPPPAPPARRRSSRASAELGRPTSITSGNQSRRTSGEIPRSSVDSQRPQMSVGHSDQPIAEESVEQEDKRTPTTARSELSSLPSGNDILADMEAFQKEIDDLRAKYEQA